MFNFSLFYVVIFMLEGRILKNNKYYSFKICYLINIYKYIIFIIFLTVLDNYKIIKVIYKLNRYPV